MMIICFVLSLALSSAWGYKIEVQGKVEMGEQLTQLFSELRDTLHQEADYSNVQPMMLTKRENRIAKKRKHLRKRKTRKAPTTPKRTMRNPHSPDATENSGGLWPLLLRNIPFLDVTEESPSKKMKEEMTLLDQMVRDKQEVSHIYGKHAERNKWPPNNIQVRVSDSRRSNKPEIPDSEGSNTTVYHN